MPNLFLISIVFIAGLMIEVLGMVISVRGASLMTGSNLIIIAFFLVLDIGKVVTISASYSYWNALNKRMKTFSLIVIAITVIISSGSAAGFLTSEFRKALIGSQETEIRIAALETQIAKYEERKKQMDAQVAAMPANYAAARVRLINSFKSEQAEIAAKVKEIEVELPALKAEALTTDSKAGPFLAVAKNMGVSVDTVIAIMVGFLILVFNPFAVFLIVLGNLLIALRKKDIVITEVKTAPVTVTAPVAAPVVAPVVEEVVAAPVVEEVVAAPVVAEVEEVEEVAIKEVISEEAPVNVTMTETLEIITSDEATNSVATAMTEALEITSTATKVDAVEPVEYDSIMGRTSNTDDAITSHAEYSVGENTSVFRVKYGDK